MSDPDSLRANIPRLKLNPWKNAAAAGGDSLRDLIETAVDVKVSGRATQPECWNPDRDSLLGTMSDYKIAKEIGTTWVQVIHRRRQLGVRSFSAAGRRPKEQNHHPEGEA